MAVVVLIAVGGRDDPKGKEGSAHFFEHMPFRGTKHFTTVKELSEPIELNAGYLNAFTGGEYTGYEVIVPSDMLEEGLSRIYDMLDSPLLRPAEIDLEREVIVEELKNNQANVGWFATEELYRRLIGEDHPVFTSVIGTEESLRAIQKSDLERFHRRYYNASNTTLVFAGSFDFDHLLTLTEKYFGRLKAGAKTIRRLAYKPLSITRPTETLRPERYNRSLYVCGRALPAQDFRGQTILKIYGDMLLRGMTSPLMKAIREERGLAYGASLRRSDYSDVTIIRFSVSTQAKNMDEVENLIWHIAPMVLANRPRFKAMKQAIARSVALGEYSVAGIVNYGADDLIEYARIISLDEYLTFLDSITFDELSEYIQPLLSRKDFLALRVDCDRRS